MAEQDLDRSEAATPYKLQKAQEQGQAARSMDVVAAVVFTSAMAYVAWQGWQATISTLSVLRLVLQQAATADPATTLWPVMLPLLMELSAVILPFMLILMGAAVLATLTQTGVIVSLEPVKFDFNRINPATGLKRLFSLRTLFDGGRACLKLAVLLLAAALALKGLLPQFHALPAMPPAEFLRLLVQDTGDLGLKMALILCLIGALDIAYTRREFGQKMRMSRRELKDEFKNREGDPRIRARLRELRREVLKRSLALRNTRTADVLLANPTHYAVALRYVHGEMDAPRMVAKGAGQVAAAMREIAYRHHIPVVRNPALARGLFREMDIDQTVPPAFHPEVARIIVWVLAMREQRHASPRAVA